MKMVYKTTKPLFAKVSLVMVLKPLLRCPEVVRVLCGPLIPSLILHATFTRRP
jgi:hypothetical protein